MLEWVEHQENKNKNIPIYQGQFGFKQTEGHVYKVQNIFTDIYLFNFMMNYNKSNITTNSGVNTC